MEKVDVYSEQGNKIGEVKLKDEAHRDGTWHRTVHVWLVSPKGELLIQRRAPEKETNPNRWGVSSIAGHITAGDNSEVTAIREAKEELGITLKEDELEYLFMTPHHMVLNDGKLIVNHLDDCYLVEREVDPSSLKLQAGEVAEVKLIHFTALEQTIRKRDPAFVQHEEYAKLFPILHQ